MLSLIQAIGGIGVFLLGMEDPQREKIYRSVALGEIDIRYATESAEALRWLTRVSRHINRICHYLHHAHGQ